TTTQTDKTNECFQAKPAVIHVTKAADAASVSAGAPIGFTVTVSNSGTGTAKGVTLSDALPGGNAAHPVHWTIDGSTGNPASFAKTPDGGTVVAGSPISFTITVHNGGPGTATNVNIDDTLPAGFTWAENPDKTECAIASGALHCVIASLANGASFSVTVSAPT